MYKVKKDVDLSHNNTFSFQKSCTLNGCKNKPTAFAHYSQTIGLFSNGMELIEDVVYECCDYHYWLLELKHDFNMEVS